MYRKAISYAMICLVLLAQVGVPMHLHYCKGMLESVSIYFSGKCDDHLAQIHQKACCKAESMSSCDKGENGCCDDKVAMLVREISSVSPSFPKWVEFSDVSAAMMPQRVEENVMHQPCLPEEIISGSGPPLYLLHVSLIYYA